jgi:hypothetical protein
MIVLRLLVTVIVLLTTAVLGLLLLVLALPGRLGALCCGENEIVWRRSPRITFRSDSSVG